MWHRPKLYVYLLAGTLKVFHIGIKEISSQLWLAVKKYMQATYKFMAIKRVTERKYHFHNNCAFWWENKKSQNEKLGQNDSRIVSVLPLKTLIHY